MMNNFMGRGGFVWFFGEVVDRQDPLCLGRVRVRVFGIHPDNEALVKTEHLPWAVPIQPITSAAAFGIGRSPTGPVQGTHVFGFFADGSDCQLPFILGTVANGTGHFNNYTLNGNGDIVEGQGTAEYNNADSLSNTPGETSKVDKLPDTFVAQASKLGPLFMRDLGIKDYQAAAILGNLYVESGLICDRRENKSGGGVIRGPSYPRGTTLSGYGWAQWTNPSTTYGQSSYVAGTGRLDKFIDFCKKNFNYDITKNKATDDMNYQFLIYELTKGEMKNIVTKPGGSSPNQWIGLKNTTTVDEATIDFMNGFERPKGAVSHLDRRKNAARQALNAMRGFGGPSNATNKPVSD